MSLLGRQFGPICRTLHYQAARLDVERAIHACIKARGGSETSVDAIEFGKNARLDAQIILAASQAASRRIPDNMLGKLKNARDLVTLLCSPQTLPGIKGIPKLELFYGDSTPPNITLINYRKRKWDQDAYREFITSSITKAGLKLPSANKKM